ncbi:DUF1161 domain-containing protein [Undibacterium sp.]|jgi:hypothetical protein|uniref:DUF1161 domain-containing protein n=1 Tax=Undibacterium sp. TaxID=1914977 RepID=UPI002CF3E3DC|nr:DUF1161 domain-containing protein [Undibacterium sp.]HTD04050.1 DUF1161 domain-containing protein [Undibacterium sp.]
MKKLILSAGLILASAQTLAAGLPCADLQTKIETKLAGKGVKNYALEVVSKDTETTNRVVGSCDADKKKIIYKHAGKKAKAEQADKG